MKVWYSFFNPVFWSEPVSDQFDSHIVKDYAQQLLGELKTRIAEMALNLDLFIEIGATAWMKSCISS